MLETILPIAFSLFLLMDPIGNIPIYLAVLADIDSKKRRKIIIRESLIALITIFIFALFGNWLMAFLSLSQESIFLAGGIVLFIMAIKMIFPEKGTLLDSFGIDGEPIVFPLAIPLVAGPSVLAAVMIYSAQLDTHFILFAAILIAWIFSFVILLFASFLQRLLGTKGVKALERLMGLILMLIAVNMILQGITLLK